MTLESVPTKPELDPFLVDETLAQRAVDLAADLLQNAQAQQNPEEFAQAAKIAGMMDDPRGKTLTMALSDQAFRSDNPRRVANQIAHLVEQYGVPKYLSWWEQAALKLGSIAGRILPQVVVPLVVAKLRQETRSVILPGEETPLRQYLQTRRADETRLNINQLGEAILGEGEAQRRLEAYLRLLARPDVEYISVKISSIFSQINLVDFDGTVEALKDRLRQLYRRAMEYQFVRADGTHAPKFVNLDMEEYRDLHLTVAAFQQVLDEPEFLHLRAGIVLQSYLPDSAAEQRNLTEWAIRRVEKGGASIKIRIVKGANLAMEQVDAAWHGWELAPYGSKAEVDANFKRMLVYGCHPQRIRAANLGIASHNLFDIAYALVLRDHYGLQDFIEMEMLEGMANHQARAVQQRADGLLLYAPVVRHEDFHSAIAYLIRRLDENTAPENFLHDLFGLEVGGEQWDAQKARFLQAVAERDQVADTARRKQNRQTEIIHFDPSLPFENVPDTDFSLPQNQAWIAEIRQRWSQATIDPIPLQIGGDFQMTENQGDGHDPSRPHTVAYRYALAQPTDIDRALDIAQHAQTEWAARPIAERKRLLIRCAEKLAESRGEMLGVMMLDGGKSVAEADPEYSEAIDFAYYYAYSLDLLESDLADVDFEALGVVVVTPPWNFPVSIPVGGVTSALMAGNSVILKPAPEATLCGWKLANILWDAGIPKDVLQFVPTTDDEVGQRLITDDRVSAVILTGAYDTARLFKSWKPSLRLFAETSGKNSLIITAMADRDQAIKDLVKSAFGNAGQKCSAASLGILEAEVYDDPNFRKQLRDAAASLPVGSAWEASTWVTPVIREPNADLHQALTALQYGESWLLEPRMIDNNPNLWSPGIKLGVQRGSWYHKTECFGPVLGLMRADNLQHAIELANDSAFGLTSGIHSLDDREIAYWKEHIHAGNIYVNRSTTGAIVQRQPFGGWKKSVFGTAKAGGPNYVLTLGTCHSKEKRSDTQLLSAAKRSFAAAWHTHFRQDHDPSQVLGESNIFRYRPIPQMILRLTDDADAIRAEVVALGAQTCGVPLVISVAPGITKTKFLQPYRTTEIVIEDHSAFLDRLQNSPGARLRMLHAVSDDIHRAATEAHIYVIDAPVLANGRVELRYYLREQAVSQTTHRYGNILLTPQQ